MADKLQALSNPMFLHVREGYSNKDMVNFISTAL